MTMLFSQRNLNISWCDIRKSECNDDVDDDDDDDADEEYDREHDQ